MNRFIAVGCLHSVQCVCASVVCVCVVSTSSLEILYKMSKNDENQPLLDKDDAKTDYTAEGENAGGKQYYILCVFLVCRIFFLLCVFFEHNFANIHPFIHSVNYLYFNSINIQFSVRLKKKKEFG